MEELIASMNHSVHVGRQGYDLAALQDQLSRTLAYNSDPYAFARQAPSQPPSSDSRQPHNSDAHFSSEQTTKPARPMVTPTASFRGAMDWGRSTRRSESLDQEGARFVETLDQDQQDTCMDTSQHPSTSKRHYVPPVATLHPPKADDYSAFAQDAFAPSNPTQFGVQPTSTPVDPWAAFHLKAPPPTTSHSFQQQDRSNVVDQPMSYQNYTNNSQQSY